MENSDNSSWLPQRRAMRFQQNGRHSKYEMQPTTMPLIVEPNLNGNNPI